ncbi:MAG TPA: SpoIIE family protein phosphatase [Geothrix sp.]|jgi:hypothetical protein
MSRRPFGIQRRIFFVFGLFFSMVVAGGGWGVARYFTAISRSQIEQRQFDEVSLLARAMDDNVVFYLQILEGAAREVPRRVLMDPRSATIWLKGRTGIRATFENGVFLLEPKGRVLAEASSVRMGARIPGHLQPFFDAAVKHRSAAVSPPYLSETTKGPAVMMAAPLLAKDGRVLAVLAGGIDLLHSDFLGEMFRYRLANIGYFQLFDSKRRMLIHPDPARLMKPIGPAESYKLYDRAIQGFEGTGERTNSAGVATISSFKRLQAIDGILVANIPISEALHPIERFRPYLKLAVASTVLLTLCLTWLISHQLADNLEDVTNQIRVLGDFPAGERIIQTKGHDEVSVLAESFNSMMQRLDAHEQQLTQAKAESDEELALTKHILQRLVEPGLLALPPHLHMETLQTQRINGDACAYRQGLPGVHFGLICDATGHGLTAGVSTIPAVHAFLSMSNRDIPLDLIYRNINSRLHQMLPAGRFVCLMLMRLDGQNAVISILNAGLPDAILLPSHGAPRTIRSRNLPAGIVGELDNPEVEHIAVSEGDRFFAATDGLQDILGDRIQAILARQPDLPFDQCEQAIRAALEMGGQDQEQQDDVSWALWEVPPMNQP